MNASKNCLSQSELCQISCVECLRRKHSLLNELSVDELAGLNANRYVVNYSKGETIFKEGTKPQGLLCLNSGKVKIVRTGVNGNEQIVGLMKPVDFLGFHALMGEHNHMSTGVALEDVSICVIDKLDFFKAIQNNPNLSFKILRRLAGDLKDAHERTLNLTQKHIRARMADALVRVIEVYGLDPETESINVSLKRSDLAALSNMTTANAIRVLSAFSQEGIISVSGRNIVPKSLKRLHEISIVGR